MRRTRQHPPFSASRGRPRRPAAAAEGRRDVDPSAGADPAPAPGRDRWPEVSAALQEAAVLVVGLARAGEAFAIQRRLTEGLEFPLLEVAQARLLDASAAVARPLLRALTDLEPVPVADQALVKAALGHADRVVVDALDGPWSVRDALPSAVAAAIARALAVGANDRAGLPGAVVEAAGSVVALCVLTGDPGAFRP